MAQNWWDAEPIAEQGQSAAAPSSPRPFTIGTPDPKAPLEVDRLRQQLEIERERIRLAQEEAARSAARDGRAANKDAQEEMTRTARGGVDTSESERTAAFLATRVAGGLRDLARIGKVGAPSLRDATIGGTTLGNYGTDEARQRVMNAQLDILDAALTLGTGAAYNQEQLEAYRKSYFPQPGDKPETVADKQRRLETLMQGARLKAGAASGLIDKAISETGMFAPNEKQGLTDADKDFLSKNARSLGEDGIRQFLAVRGLTDEQGIKQALDYYKSGGTENARVNYNDTPLSQGLSGINEGIASTLGAPVDLANSALGLGAQGINYLAGTDLSVSDKPFLGSEWIGDKLRGAGSIGPESQRDGMPFIRRVGQSVGAAAIPIGATARTAKQGLGMFGSALSGGLGAATAREVAPGNPLAEMGGELLGSGVGLGGALAKVRGTAQRGIEAAVPTIDQLKQQASNLYRQAEANGVTAAPMQTQKLADDITTLLRQEGTISPTGRLSEVHPKVKEAAATIGDYAGQPMTPTQMQTVRGIIGDAAGSLEPKERRTAGLLMDQFDDFVDPLAPQLSEARAVASRYLNAEKIAKAKELADVRASQFSGSGLENALRTEFRGLDRNLVKGKDRSSNQALTSAIEDVSRGTAMSNVYRGLGKLAPTGTVSFGLGTVAPATLAGSLFGPVGAGAAATTTAGLGMFGRRMAERSATRGADLAELVARNGGELPKPQVLTPEIERMIAAGMFGQQSQYLK